MRVGKPASRMEAAIRTELARQGVTAKREDAESLMLVGLDLDAIDGTLLLLLLLLLLFMS